MKMVAYASGSTLGGRSRRALLVGLAGLSLVAPMACSTISATPAADDPVIAAQLEYQESRLAAYRQARGR